MGIDFVGGLGQGIGTMEQIREKPKWDSWRGTERMMKATRDQGMKVTLPQLRFMDDKVSGREVDSGSRNESDV